MSSVLITDCLQHDFVGPIGRYDGLPNSLHVGHDESLRLLGQNPAEGPVARAIAWAHGQPDEVVKVVHVRDWHNSADPEQARHLQQFGVHCIMDSKGAEFVFPLQQVRDGKKVELVNATTLSNFVGASLGQILDPLITGPIRIGLMGVWTEAKITFLAYDLRARYPRARIAVCSALTASSSRQNHFVALDQLERIIGAEILPSVGEFVDFLGGELEEAPLIGFSEKHPSLQIVDSIPLTDTDRQLVRYLFRGCREVSVRSLDGGFSGNAVLAAMSVDLRGYEQVPHVVKIGPMAAVGQERTAFERIEEVLGNSAPQVADFADLKDRGAIKYRYAGVGGGTSKSFQKLFNEGVPMDEVRRILAQVFGEQLGRLHRAAEPEVCDLLVYYDFKSGWAASVRNRVDGVMGGSAADELEFPGGRRVANIATFYEKDLDGLPRIPRSRYFAHLHGDLNGANILVDAHGNVWLIDFFHSHRGHVLKDLVKLENDVLYIFTKIDEAEFTQALELTDLILSVEDLARPLPPLDENVITSPKLRRAYEVVTALRGFYPQLIRADREPAQLLIAQIRYAVHTLGFDECSPLQKKWALYTASSAAAQLKHRLETTSGIRIDWLPERHTAPAKIGFTLLPGRRDVGRSLDDDIKKILSEGVGAVVCLVAQDEFQRYGVEGLLDIYRDNHLEVLHIPTLDGTAPNGQDLNRAVEWIDRQIAEGRNVLIHCVGGLGRAGTVGACWLKRHGLDAASAINAVRSVRSRRAIETLAQEQAIDRFDA